MAKAAQEYDGVVWAPLSYKDVSYAGAHRETQRMAKEVWAPLLEKAHTTLDIYGHAAITAAVTSGCTMAEIMYIQHCPCLFVLLRPPFTENHTGFMENTYALQILVDDLVDMEHLAANVRLLPAPGKLRCYSR